VRFGPSLYRRMSKGRKPMTKILTVRIDAELKAEAERAAAADNRTLSNLIVKLLRDHLAKHGRGKAQP
jgi:predicted HicB family RNase H-like nuclease